MLIEKEKLSDLKKDEIRKDYLISKFFTEESKQQMMEEIAIREKTEDLEEDPAQNKPKYIYR